MRLHAAGFPATGYPDHYPQGPAVYPQYPQYAPSPQGHAQAFPSPTRRARLRRLCRLLGTLPATLPTDSHQSGPAWSCGERWASFVLHASGTSFPHASVVYVLCPWLRLTAERGVSGSVLALQPGGAVLLPPVPRYCGLMRCRRPGEPEELLRCSAALDRTHVHDITDPVWTLWPRQSIGRLMWQGCVTYARLNSLYLRCLHHRHEHEFAFVQAFRTVATIARPTGSVGLVETTPLYMDFYRDLTLKMTHLM